MGHNRWSEFNATVIVKNIHPFATDGLREKLKNYFTKKLQKEFKGKRVTQDIANLKVIVSKKHVIASFDKVLRVNNIPLVVPTELSFELIKGDVTNWNLLCPIGKHV